MSEAFDIGVLGAGGWGTALAVLFANAGKKIALWARDAQAVARMRAAGENPRLPGIKLPKNLTLTETFPDAAILMLAVPMQHARATLIALPPRNTPLVLCCKGLEAGTLLLPPELLAELHPEMPAAMLTGPNFAREIAASLPAATVLAATSAELRGKLTAALRTHTLRLYGSSDITGAALGGAAKNVIAIAAGVVIGAGLGENARAALITRGIVEIARLAAAYGGRAETVTGLSGMGDLLLTCTGASSRNFSLGFELGKGQSLPDILASRTGVTEGVSTAPALLARAQRSGVEMPITQAVTELLAGTMTVSETVFSLMSRALKDE
jgi:glycerol-3-phosphate dehydrogenase (NAD(P)+)